MMVASESSCSILMFKIEKASAQDVHMQHAMEKDQLPVPMIRVVVAHFCPDECPSMNEVPDGNGRQGPTGSVSQEWKPLGWRISGGRIPMARYFQGRPGSVRLAEVSSR